MKKRGVEGLDRGGRVSLFMMEPLISHRLRYNGVAFGWDGVPTDSLDGLERRLSMIS